MGSGFWAEPKCLPLCPSLATLEGSKMLLTRRPPLVPIAPILPPGHLATHSRMRHIDRYSEISLQAKFTLKAQSLVRSAENHHLPKEVKLSPVRS